MIRSRVQFPLCSEKGGGEEERVWKGKGGFKSLSTKRMARKTHAIGYRLGETRW